MAAYSHFARKMAVGDVMATKLRPVDSLEITFLVDNVVELGPDNSASEVRKSWQWIKEKKARPTDVFGGHGLSMLVRTFVGNEVHQIVYDAGPSAGLISHNLSVLGISLTDTSAVVMSHGHNDHSGGLLFVLKRIGASRTPVYIHPRAFLKRGKLTTTEQGDKIRELEPAFPKMEMIIEHGGEPYVSSQPELLAENTIMTSGEIPRLTSYERGVPGHRAFVDGKWENDEAIADDTCLIALVRNKGLVILTGCCHAGLTNTLQRSMSLVGVNDVGAVLGGFHLVGKTAQAGLEQTVSYLKSTNLQLLVPAHCTGWQATHLLARSFPAAYASSGVGSRYTVQSTDVKAY